MCCEVSVQIMELFNDGAIKVLEYAKTGINSKHSIIPDPVPICGYWVRQGIVKGKPKKY